MKQQGKMQKGKNVKKAIILVGLICSINLGYSQKKLEGVFAICSGIVDNGECLKFQFFKNGIFKRNTTGELSEIDYGKGHYFIRNDSLVLNYDLTELKEESYFKAKKYYNYKDSITISLSVYDFNKKPIYNLGVYSFPKYKSTESNKKGKAYLRFKKQKIKEKIALYLEGEFLAKQIIYLDYDANYIIDAYMSTSEIPAFGHLRAYKNQINKYKILKISEEEIKLKTQNSFLLLKKRKD